MPDTQQTGTIFESSFGENISEVMHCKCDWWQVTYSYNAYVREVRLHGWV